MKIFNKTNSINKTMSRTAINTKDEMNLNSEELDS